MSSEFFHFGGFQDIKIVFNLGEETSQKYHLNSYILADFRISKFKIFFNPEIQIFFNHGEETLSLDPTKGRTAPQDPQLNNKSGHNLWHLVRKSFTDS